jgi:glycosyltransferase involved in cell wall biosynthesis
MTTADRPGQPPDHPVVSVIVANYNGAAYLADAIRSVQRQTLRDLEIIVSDDGSQDDSIAIVKQLAADDPRIRLLQSECNRGPAAARNRALAAAKGEWIAVMDGDDLMHPERLTKLIRAASRDGAELAADNLIEFFEDSARPPRPFLTGKWAAGPRWFDLVGYIKQNIFFGRGPQLGFLKPVFCASLLRTTSGYDETLRIGEDYDLVARLLVLGKKLRVYPEPLYFYRKHRQSLSDHGMDTSAIEALRAANQRLLSQVSAAADPKAAAVIKTRMQSIETAMLLQKLIESLKARQWLESFRIALTKPRVAALLRIQVGIRLRQFVPRLR